LSIAEIQHKIVLQSVGYDFHITQGEEWEAIEKRESRIVFIGTGMNEDNLFTELKNLLTKIEVT